MAAEVGHLAVVGVGQAALQEAVRRYSSGRPAAEVVRWSATRQSSAALDAE